MAAFQWLSVFTIYLETAGGQCGVKYIKHYIGKLLPEYSRVPLLLVIVWNGGAYYGGRLIAQNWPHDQFDLPLDTAIPFLPWTVSIYILSYFFWIVNYILAARRDKASAYRFFCADFITRCVCLFFFLALPTTNIRPGVVGNGIWSALMRLIYNSDAADNLFPSIHCIASYLSAVGIKNDKRVPLWYRVFSYLLTVAICISTVTTKQHVVVDVAGGIALAAVAYWIAGFPSVSVIYIRFVKWLSRIEVKTQGN